MQLLLSDLGALNLQGQPNFNLLLTWTWLLGFAEHAKVKGQLLLRTKESLVSPRCWPESKQRKRDQWSHFRTFLQSAVTLMDGEMMMALLVALFTWSAQKPWTRAQLQELSGHPAEDDLKQEVILFWNWPMFLPVSASQFCSFCFRGNVSFIFPLMTIWSLLSPGWTESAVQKELNAFDLVFSFNLTQSNSILFYS